MQPTMNPTYLNDETKKALIARPLFKRRIVNKDGTIDCFEIDCLSKHIAKISQPTDEQKVQLQVLMELKRHLDGLTLRGRALPKLDDLLRIHPGNVSPPIRANKNSPQLNKATVNPTAIPSQPKPANSTRPVTPSNPMVSNLLNRLSETANGATKKPPAIPPKDRGNPLLNDASAYKKPGLQNSGASTPLSAALAQHQCAIR